MRLGHHSLRRWGIAAVVSCSIAAYLCPTLTRDPDRLDVVVLGDDDIATSADEIGRHLRERGLAPSIDTSFDPCVAGTLERAASGARAVIVSYRDSEIARCPEAFAAGVAELAAPIFVRRDATTTSLRAEIVDAQALVPAAPSARSGCQWWEPLAPAGAVANCETDGLITIRDAGGSLTLAGRDRLARVIAGAIR